MMQTMPFKKIVCAVDMLSNKEFLRLTLQSLEALAQSQNLKVEPVQILQENFSIHQDTDLLEHSFDDIVKAMELKRFMKLKVLTAMNMYPVSYEQITKTLVKYAEDEQALLAVHSSNNKGLELFFMGSFTESVLKQSRNPLLVINTDSKKANPPKRILAPVSLKSGTDLAIEELSIFAKSLDAEVVLFHLLRGPPLLVLTGSELDYDQLSYDYVTPQKDLLEEKGRILKRNGVKVDLIIEESSMKLSEAINLAAQKYLADLIAIPVRHKFFRKYSRTAVDVIRSASNSVFYWHLGTLLLEANKQRETTQDVLKAPVLKASAF